ncbi:patatin-like phospholipase family protein [Alkalibacter saccharofermentans]|uniref:Patatin-like phospholipase n=1 Tax=Alkalibacter saccharofermentans DSM 14828 TaxID=1120975 RepID=A0A1M4WZM1_9FIRM|nr:patatin-like phospholipase family protein [Alkalibacter saccharofermentans]SHE86698.1 Patatin-like phospholipase [Alkalibacter saccharofermentans DSM 14828]
MLGIVLEGGGAKGAYQIGVWKAIEELKISFQGVVGASVGALNGAMMVQGDFDRAKSLWETMEPKRIIAESAEIIDRVMDHEFITDDILCYRQEMKYVFGIEGFNIDPFKEILDECVNESAIRTSGKDFGLVTIDLEADEGIELFKEDIPKGKMKDFLLATSFLPFFKEEKICGKRYLDGGFYNNLPMNMLVKKGYKDLLVVKLNDREDRFPVDEKNLNVVRIIPSKNLGKTMDFSNDRILSNMETGYIDAMKTLSVL